VPDDGDDDPVPDGYRPGSGGKPSTGGGCFISTAGSE